MSQSIFFLSMKDYSKGNKLNRNAKTEKTVLKSRNFEGIKVEILTMKYSNSKCKFQMSWTSTAPENVYNCDDCEIAQLLHK